MRFVLDRRDPDQVGPDTFTHALDLPATRAEVFAALASEDTWPEWFPQLVASRWLTPAPHGVGSLRRVTLRGAEVLEHFVAWEPDRRMTFFLQRASVPLVSHLLEDYQLADAPGGSRLTWRVHYRTHRPLRVLQPALAPMFGLLFARGIRNLGAWLADQRGAAGERLGGAGPDDHRIV